MEILKKMSKEELIQEIQDQQQIILDLKVKLESKGNGMGRKSQVLNVLQENAAISIVKIAEKLGISTKNVSSQLTYLRSDGYKIFTDNNGRKVLMD
jgi:biotin operon repressor